MTRRASRWIAITVSASLAAVFVFVATTWAALESSGVVVVETQSIDTDSLRQTHVWFVEHDGRLCLEAGHPDNGWVRDLASQQTLRIVGGRLDGDYRFSIDASAEAHREIRDWMRAKYGWRDVWIGLLFDTSRSQRVVLERDFSTR